MKAAFFDRDGTLNVDRDYLYKIEDLRWVPYAREALYYLNQRGYTVFVITNQSGVARGYYTETEVKALHERMASDVREYGAKIEKSYYCPHHKEGKVAEYAVDCDCRKPKPGMLLQAFAEYDIDKEESFLIGDGKRDIEAAEAAGIKGYLYQGGSLLELVKRVVEGN